ncbi:DNA sulfur modification protein DndD [Gramella lutea]|uniref:DNA sulfur modification protein DndD n=1 Tax=Christiangramia lutea TaxID=1607951 RepID=A0A9X1V109_9FLAO|nr:DNA sulfur modification protein DndD [Christiangramia lutea]MCH4821676.1 DNA sulfur modification protein DndD [Christiangramia lutea]
MIIKSIELNNFRIYKGENSIDLSVNEENNIIVISGKNGFGKTTFLMSLVWCLYGRQMSDVDDIYKKEIESSGNYRQYIRNSLNRLAAHEGETKFSVSITFGNVNIPDVTCNELKVTRTYYTEGNKDEEIEVLIDNHKSELVKDVTEEHFIRDFIMPKEIAKFFFFDAEKIVSLAEIHTAEERLKLSKAYSEVLGIKQYENLKDDLGNYLTKLKSDTANAEEKRRLRELKVETENAEEKIIEIKDEISELEEDRLALKFDINQLQEKLISKGSLITVEELNELKSRKETLESNVATLNSDLKTHYEFIPFAIAGNLLTKVLEQVIKEREIILQKFDSEKIDGLTDDIINDLISVPKPADLVFNHKVQGFYVENLKKLLKKHLSHDSNQNEELEIIHNFSESEKAELNAFVNNIKLSFKETFNRINSQFLTAKNELNDISKRIKLAEEKAEDALVKADREKKAQLEKEYDEKVRTMGALSGDIEENRNIINNATKEIKRISDKLEVSKDKQKISQEVEKSIQYLKTFIAEFKLEKKQSLAKRIKEGLDLLLHKKSFIDDVSVEILGENIEINLIDSRGKEINKDSLSKGEQQLYATALLKGLVEESNIDFPVFIDSPMQKFDVDHSSSIVKHFYPEVSDQVIIFPLLKKEMSEEEYNILLPKVNKAYLIQNYSNENSSFFNVDPASELFEVFQKEKVDAI